MKVRLRENVVCIVEGERREGRRAVPSAMYDVLLFDLFLGKKALDGILEKEFDG